MVKVEPFGYPLDNRFIQRLDAMVRRCTQKNPKRDAVLLFEGAEGEGKTSYSIACAFYIANQTGRKFTHENVFFDLEKMIIFLQTTDNQIAIWDEPALQALSKDALTKMVKNLERLLMMARKKRHFIMINLAYFNKFSEYIVWQRPLGMVHVYSKGGKHAGRFKYIKKRNLEKLWQDWRRKHQRNYHKWSNVNAMGTFPDVLNPDYKKNCLSAFDLDAYERNKDAAIMMIGNTQVKERDFKKETYFRMREKDEEDKVKRSRIDYSFLVDVSKSSITTYSKEYEEKKKNEEQNIIIEGLVGKNNKNIGEKEVINNNE